MKTSTKDKIKGSFHEVKGTIKEEVGKVTNDRDLTAEGKAEKKAGKVQQRIGHAKEAVAKLKRQLAAIENWIGRSYSRASTSATCPPSTTEGSGDLRGMLCACRDIPVGLETQGWRARRWRVGAITPAERFEQGVVNPNLAVVFDEAQFSEAIHEKTHPGPGCANHLSQYLLADLGNHCLAVCFPCRTARAATESSPAAFRWN